MTWEGAPRTTTAEWKRTRLRVLERDGHRCTWVQDGERCSSPATEVDHNTPVAEGGTDEDDNLRALCTEHHARKSSIEGNRARWRFRRNRKAEPHPGLQGGGG